MKLKVVGAVIIKDNKILAAQRPYDKSLGGYWEFPGGKLEKGESHEDALVRELQEELGVYGKVNELLVVQDSVVDNVIIELSTYLLTDIVGEINVKEHIQIKWLSKEELDEYNWAPADLSTVRKIKELLND